LVPKTLHELISEHHEFWLKHCNDPDNKAIINKLHFIEQQIDHMIKQRLLHTDPDTFLNDMYKLLTSYDELSDYTISRIYKILRTLIKDRITVKLTDHYHFIINILRDEGIYLETKVKTPELDFDLDESDQAL